MKPSVSLVTLGVADLGRSLAFYRDGLGWPTDGIVGTEFPDGAVVFFALPGGLRLALWPRQSLANDSGLPAAGPGQPPACSLAHNVATRAEVDAVMAEALAAGATVIKRARDTAWGGYAGYFADPDGHLWEVAWNPAWLPPDAATA